MTKNQNLGGVTDAKSRYQRKVNNLDKIPVSVLSTRERVEVSKEISLEFRNLPLSTWYNTLRFLLTKISLEGRLSDQEHYILLHAFDTCFSSIEKTWVLKTRTHLVRMKFLIECYQRILYLEVPVKERFSRIANGYLYRKFLHQPNAYFGRKKFFNVKNFVVRKNRKLQRSPPPQRFIGVGYRDKGTCQIKHYDGTPSWQDVATSESIRSQYHSSGKGANWTGPELAILVQWGALRNPFLEED